MGNELSFCCKSHLKAENTEINRIKFEDEKRKEKIIEQMDKTKSSIIKNDDPISILKDKSQEIFEDSNHFFDVIPSKIENEKNIDYEDKPIENAKEVKERCAIPNSLNFSKITDKSQNEAYLLDIQSTLLNDFYIDRDNKEFVDLDKFIGEKVLKTKKRNGNVKEDIYLKAYFDSYFDKLNNNNTEINQDGKVTLSAVFIDKSIKDEIYCGSWILNKDVLFTSNIQNLKSAMKFNGFGVLIKEDKSFVEGVFSQGELNGPGRVILANGDLFKGVYTNGFLNDIGIFVDSEGNIYNGQFKLNIMDGYGEEIFLDNSTFKGEYKRNKKNGKGKFIWADGSFYEGELLDNNLHGKGIYKWASGLKYEGEWSRGVMQGHGIITTANGEYYEGEFKDNKKDGFGLFWWNEKKYYLGYWQHGVQHGIGKLIKEGKLLIGVWHKGKFEKHMEKEQIKFPNFNFHKRVAF